MRGPRFDTTINLGHVLTIVALLAGGFGAFSAVKEAVSSIDTRLQNVTEQTAQIGAQVDALTPVVATNTTNIDNLRTIVVQQYDMNIRIQELLGDIREDLAGLTARFEDRVQAPF